MCPYTYLVRSKPPVSRIYEVPCGRCFSCRRARAREWSIRLIHELSVSPDACFVTLTYDEDSCPDFVSKSELQKFVKRLRKSLPRQSLKYYAIGDYGDQTARPHYHLILYGLSYSDPRTAYFIAKAWPFGHIDVGTCTDQSISYVTKYLLDALQRSDLPKEKKPFALMSQGLGKRYAEMHRYQLNQQVSCMRRGKKISIPRYYIKKGFVTNLQVDKERKKRLQELEKKFEDSGLTWSQFARQERTERLQNIVNITSKIKNKKDSL